MRFRPDDILLPISVPPGLYPACSCWPDNILLSFAFNMVNCLSLSTPNKQQSYISPRPCVCISPFGRTWADDTSICVMHFSSVILVLQNCYRSSLFRHGLISLALARSTLPLLGSGLHGDSGVCTPTVHQGPTCVY